MVEFAWITQFFNTVEYSFHQLCFCNCKHWTKYSNKQILVWKYWLHLEIYTKNVVFGPKLPRLPKFCGFEIQNQKLRFVTFFHLWSSIFMQKIKIFDHVVTEKNASQTDGLTDGRMDWRTDGRTDGQDWFDKENFEDFENF